MKIYLFNTNPTKINLKIYAKENKILVHTIKPHIQVQQL